MIDDRIARLAAIGTRLTERWRALEELGAEMRRIENRLAQLREDTKQLSADIEADERELRSI